MIPIVGNFIKNQKQRKLEKAKCLKMSSNHAI